MRRAAASTAAAAAALALFGAPAAARADATITALPRDRFEPAEVTIDAGERVTFANRDIRVHDVFGEGFKSARADPGKDARVEGVEKLGAGRHAFTCSLHPNMTGTLVVRGDPAPGEPPAPEGDPPPADTTKPRLTVRVRGRVVEVRVDEAARIVVRAAGSRRSRAATGPATLRFRLPRRPRSVVVTATDAAGNVATVRRG